MRYIVLIFVIFTSCSDPVHSQSSNSIPSEGILIENWKFKDGDNPDWAKADHDDDNWDVVNISKPISDSDFRGKKIFWLRAEIQADRLGKDSLFSLLITQFGASEIYVNGGLVKSLGTILSQGRHKRYNPHNHPVPVILRHGENSVVAIRFAADLPPSDWVTSRSNVPLIRVKLQQLEHALNNLEDRLKRSRFLVGFRFVSGALSLLFLIFFLFSPKQLLYLFFGLFNLFLVLVNIVAAYLGEGQYDLAERAYLISCSTLISRLIGMNILLFILHALNRMKPVFWWYVGFMLLVDFPLTILLPVEYHLVSSAFRATIIVICAWLAYHAFTSRDKIDLLVGLLACSVILVNTSFTLQQFTGIDITQYITGLAAPILTTLAIAFYLSLRYSRVNRDLEYQLHQVKQLSEDNLSREREKQEILSAQAVELERQVHERTAELHEQKKELQAALDGLKATQSRLIQSEKMASLGELTAGIAHEIQNPLNFVNNFSEVNKELIDEAGLEIEKGNILDVKAILNDIKDNEEKINHHGKRADAIVKGMLQHSRASSGQREITDINTLCEEYLRLAYHGYRAKDKSFNAKFETDFDPSLPKINVVPQDIGRVILNLINNAFYAVNEKEKSQGSDYEPRILVATKNLGDKIEIKVNDNGNGIPDNIKEKIFQPFFTTKPTGQGTGLGLSLAYDIITKGHGGELKVETLEGSGSEFIISLPL